MQPNNKKTGQTGSENVVEVRDLVFSHQGTDDKVYEGISFDIKKHDIAAFLGPNGAGKTTMFYLLLNIYKANKGSIIIEGRDLKKGKKNKEYIRNTIGFVFQDPNDQLFCPTVWEDIAFGPHNQGKERAEVERIVKDVVAKLEIEHLINKKPHQMSLGEMKISSIATVLALEPEIYLLDEPLASLDAVSKKRVLNIIKELHTSGKTIIFSTHDTRIAAELANTVILIKNAKEIEVRPKDKILKDLEKLQSLGLDANPVSEIFVKIADALNRPELKEDVPITVEEAVQKMKKIIV